jgi:hypothetical protein
MEENLTAQPFYVNVNVLLGSDSAFLLRFPQLNLSQESTPKKHTLERKLDQFRTFCVPKPVLDQFGP